MKVEHIKDNSVIIGPHNDNEKHNDKYLSQYKKREKGENYKSFQL